MTTDDLCGVRLSALVDAYRDPHALYRRARELGGVCHDEKTGCWVVTDYATVRAVLSDPRFSSDLGQASEGAGPPPATGFISAAIRKQILFSDGDAHKRVQGAIVRETTRRGHLIRPRIEEIARKLLSRHAPPGCLDLVQDFFGPFAAESISLIMGVPLKSDDQRDELRQWSDTFGAVTSGYFKVRVQDIEKMGAFFRELVRARATVPSDDLIQTLLREEVFEDEEDLVINCMTIFGAGRVTTQKVLGDGVSRLLPEWERWRETILRNPQHARRLAEELVRAVTPTRMLARFAVGTVELADSRGRSHVVEKGSRTVLFLESANRDPTVFDDPDSIIGTRQPNPHVGFGHGPHRCPGAGLARVELQVALEALFRTFEGLSPDASRPPEWDPNPNLGGYRSFPCVTR